MTFDKTLSPIKNHGSPPKVFLETLLKWGSEAAEDIFAPNDNPHDIYASVRPILGEKEDDSYVWNGPLHRRACLLEVIRVHAGLESDWTWDCGNDTTRRQNQGNMAAEEAGLLQVSFDSLNLDADGSLKSCLRRHLGHDPLVWEFVTAMKTNRALALEYYARLVRLNVQWAGPIVRGERWLTGDRPQHDNVHENLSVASMYEIMDLLKQVT